MTTPPTPWTTSCSGRVWEVRDALGDWVCTCSDPRVADTIVEWSRTPFDKLEDRIQELEDLLADAEADIHRLRGELEARQ